MRHAGQKWKRFLRASFCGTAIKRNEVKPGQVVVLRGLGVRGGPGLAMTSAVVARLVYQVLLARVFPGQ